MAFIRALADGRDPASGESFPAGSPYRQADTVRALYAALEALDSPPRRRREPRQVDPERPKLGSAWTPEEEQQLHDAFQTQKLESANLPFDLSAEASAKAEAKEAAFADWRSRAAAAHGRTPGAITARLVKLGLIADVPSNRAGQGNRPRPSPESPVPDQAPPTPPVDLTDEERRNLPF